LDAQCSEPWRNREFRHPDLKAWVRENRGRLLSASLTLARAWFVAGGPSATTPILGSFEESCRIAGGILQFAGISGFLGNLDELYKQSDPTTTAWESFLVELHLRLPKSGFKAAELAVRVREDHELRASLPEDLGDLEPAASFQRRLGKALLKRIGRRYGDSGVHLIRLGTRQGAVVWGVRMDKEDLRP
jgi:putative DNA primase/helicase